MIRECVNCKYGMGGGSDVWCTHDPRGKESYMAPTDCEYFEWIDILKKDVIGYMKENMR